MDTKENQIKTINAIPQNIGFLIDVDGFNVNNKFLVKELAIGNMETFEIVNFTYKVGDFDALSEENQRHVTWVTNHVHGLKFNSLMHEYEQSDVLKHINRFCISARNHNKLIGYKGGHFEMDMLNQLNCQDLAFNIENVKCPKLAILLKYYPEAINRKCSNHLPLPHNIVHCPSMEVYCFMRYLKSKMS